MKKFASPGYRIWNLSREAKLVYTGFGLFALCALAVSMLFYEDMVGPRTAGVSGYYAGAPAARADAARPAEAHPSGPVIDMPSDEPPPASITVAVTYRKLLEVTHFHLFTVPVFLLIIAHLFMLTGARAKTAWIGGGFGSSFAHLLAPWLIRYGSPRWSWLYPASGAVMALTLTVMTVYPMVSMWTGPRRAPAARPDVRDRDADVS